MSGIEAVLSSLDKVKRVKPNEWKACCPAHNDRSPSLGITLLDSGKILFNCWASCSQDSVLDALRGLGLKSSDWNPDFEYQSNYVSELERHFVLVFEGAVLRGESVTKAEKERYKLTKAKLGRAA